jgi:hypothetical protein
VDSTHSSSISQEAELPVCTLSRQSFQCDREAGSERIHPAKVAILRALASPCFMRYILLPVCSVAELPFSDTYIPNRLGQIHEVGMIPTPGLNAPPK